MLYTLASVVAAFLVCLALPPPFDTFIGIPSATVLGMIGSVVDSIRRAQRSNRLFDQARYEEYVNRPRPPHE